MLAQCCLPLSMSNEVKVWSCLASLRAVQSRQSMRQSPLLKLTGRRNDRAGHTARSKEGADAVGPTPSATPATPASRQTRLRRPFGRWYWLITLHARHLLDRWPARSIRQPTGEDAPALTPALWRLALMSFPDAQLVADSFAFTLLPFVESERPCAERLTDRKSVV